MITVSQVSDVSRFPQKTVITAQAASLTTRFHILLAKSKSLFLLEKPVRGNYRVFLAALSSSRSLGVRRSVRPSVRRYVRRSAYLCEKVIFRVSKGN